MHPRQVECVVGVHTGSNSWNHDKPPDHVVVTQLLQEEESSAKLE